jgi:hypothetical protein
MEGAIGTVVKTSTSSAAYPDRTTLKLSDAFEEVEGNTAVNLELTVKVFNIEKGRNTDIVRKCEPLGGYVDFVHIAGESHARIKRENPGMGRDLAVEKQFRRLRCSLRHGRRGTPKAVALGMEGAIYMETKTSTD